MSAVKPTTKQVDNKQYGEITSILPIRVLRAHKIISKEMNT
jgi:hypothetical protein